MPRSSQRTMVPAAERPRSVQLNELSEPINMGQAFKAAACVQSKSSKGKRGKCAKVEKATSQLTTKHPCIKHLYACEQLHSWQWMPDARLSKLWTTLEPQQQARVIQTHELLPTGGSAPSQQFCVELSRHLDTVKCHASEVSKQKMASLIWRDSSNSEIFKNMFRTAVEENMAMIIDMEVMAAVDSVLQDYCAELPELAEMRHWRSKFLVRGLMFSVFISWLLGTRWTSWLTVLAVITLLIYVWITSPPCDPRTFEVGSERWSQYREHEHVRLMFLSAMMCVFEVRLLQIWESRRKQERLKQAPSSKNPSTAHHQEPRRHGEFTDGPLRANATPATKHLGSRRCLRQRRQKGDVAQEKADGEVREERDRSPSEQAEETAREREREREDQEEEEEEGEEGQDLDMEPEGEDGASGDEMYGDDSEGDEIDAEFARRVREHFQSRAQAARGGSQTARGNQVLKSLCEKLKNQLEDRV